MDKPAQILRENNAEIMKTWQGQVVQVVSASRESDAGTLYDHLPNIINDIADLMARYDRMEDINEDKKYIEILENSEKHGRQRAVTAHYTVDQIVHEYIVLHRTLSGFLISHDGYDQKVSDLLKYVIETSILKSVGSFSRSIEEMQEKLIGTLAHDIRNPLSAARLALQMMEEDKDGMWGEKMLAASRRSVDRALGLVEGLLDGITVKSGEGMMLDFENVDILKDIRSVHAESREVYASEINLECRQSEITGVFDRTAIRRLIENLITNAVRYGGAKRPVTINVRDSGDAVHIGVHNHGNPISQERQGHIFKFLGQENKGNRPVSRSWGMGLTLAQMVAEAHGGGIGLKSNEETGTLFDVTLYKHHNEPGKRRTKLIFDEQDNQG